MAQTVNLGATAIAIGPRQFVIDGLPANSVGFELLLGVNASWTGAAGKLFDIAFDLALVSGQFKPWINFSVFGGPVRDKFNANIATWAARGFWPGELLNGGRKVLRAADMQIRLNVAQAFNVDSVIFRTI